MPLYCMRFRSTRTSMRLGRGWILEPEGVRVMCRSVAFTKHKHPAIPEAASGLKAVEWHPAHPDPLRTPAAHGESRVGQGRAESSPGSPYRLQREGAARPGVRPAGRGAEAWTRAWTTRPAVARRGLRDGAPPPAAVDSSAFTLGAHSPLLHCFFAGMVPRAAARRPWARTSSRGPAVWRSWGAPRPHIGWSSPEAADTGCAARWTDSVGRSGGSPGRSGEDAARQAPGPRRAAARRRRWTSAPEAHRRTRSAQSASRLSCGAARRGLHTRRRRRHRRRRRFWLPPGP